MKRLVILCFALNVVLVGACTDSVRVTEDTTVDTDWTPEYRVSQNNYHRAEITVTLPPRKTIFRNIREYRIEYRRATSEFFSTLKSFGGSDLISRYFNRRVITQPALVEDSTYVLRIKILYSDSTVRTSPETSITSPRLQSKIIKRLPLYSHDGGYPFRLYKGQLIALANGGRSLVSYDTTLGNGTVLLDSLYPHDGGYGYNTLAILGDHVYLSGYWSHSEFREIRKVNLPTLQDEGIIHTTVPAGNPVLDIGCRGDTLYSLWGNEATHTMWITQSNVMTGATITMSDLHTSSVHAIDITDQFLWSSSRVAFDNRLQKRDPVSFQVLNEYQTPLFQPYPAQFSIDNQSVWMSDGEYPAFVKFLWRE